MNITFASKKGLSLITVGVIALASTSKDVRQHVTALFNGAHKTLEGFASDDHLLRVLTEQVEDAQKTIRKGDLLVKRHSDRAASLETELTRLRSAGETARARLAVLRPAVEAKDGILINSVRYTSDEVLREANALVAAVADAQREEGVRNTELKAEKERIAAARGSLEKARTQLADLQTKTRDVELRLASARAGAETRSLVKDLNDEFKSQVDGGAAHTLAVLEDRIAEMETEATDAVATVAPQGVVQWDTQPATSERIKAILSTGTVVVSSDSPCHGGN
jgi:chromosome segregation ATPase